MHIHLGGYKCTPEQIQAWFNERGVELQEGFYTVLGNRYLRKENFQARIRSCDYQGKHCFLVLTHKATTHGPDKVIFEENDEARNIKVEMGLQDVEFVTIAVWVG